MLGDIDAVVLSSSFDADGARNPLPPALTATVAQVPGVQSVSGVIDTFAAESGIADPGVTPSLRADRRRRDTPILFSYHKDDERAPRRRPRTGRRRRDRRRRRLRRAIRRRRRHGLALVAGQDLEFQIVGTFDLPGVDLTGIPLAAMSAAHQSPELQLDRLDVKLAPGADAANVRDAIAAAVGNAYTVVPPSAISFPDQRLAQVEIQHAYWALLSPDPSERSTSGVGRRAREKANYAKYSDLARRSWSCASRT